MTIDINISNWQYSIYVLNFLPVIAGFYRFFPLSRQKYFLPWQKPNPEPAYIPCGRKMITSQLEKRRRMRSTSEGGFKGND